LDARAHPVRLTDGASLDGTDILLVHWNQREADERARVLHAVGQKIRILCDSEKPNFLAICRSLPDLFAVDLTRLPSQGREIAGYFRRTPATRQVPTLFSAAIPNESAARAS
jgi:hypothetical protein